MSRLFATPDIAALVAAFPPPSPLRERPSLVRSASGDTLISSRKVAQDFRELLATCPERVRLSDLPRRLGVLRTDWLLSCYDGPVYSSRDRQSVLSTSALQSTWSSVKDSVRKRPSSLLELVSREDVALESLEKLLLLKDPHSKDVRRYDDDNKQLLYSTTLVKSIADHLANANTGDSEGIDLTASYPNVPLGLLKHLGDEALKRSTEHSGSFEIQNQCVYLIPPDYTAGLEAKRKAAYDRAVAEVVDQLRDEGFCRVPSSSTSTGHIAQHGPQPVADDVRAALQDDLAGSIVELAIASEGVTVLITDAKLSEGLEALRCAAPQGAATVWHQLDGGETNAVLKQRAIGFVEENIHRPYLLSLLKTSRATELDPLILDKFAKLDQDDEHKFGSLTTERFLAPVQLYMDGISTVVDPVLKEHLEEFVGDYCRRDVIPPFLQTLREDRLLIDKGRKRDVEKMQQAVSEAKSLTAIHAALSKLARKQKVGSPSPALLQKIKQQTVQQKIKAMRKMRRGSDLLQNLIWVLLASKGPGLFISSGKDTTRMIKHYQSVGDTDAAQKLVEVRDKLKAGQESGEDLGMMVEMAVKAMDDLSGP
ncbi:hypothetical protein Tdes44962_MAKER05562 [Teratosphaeria destructans]|uniref:Uncharacterized protein n=1 Tax=Teratosphaeria destructans TaxID=418781 RepID=A0A9W7SJL6_9PEZI|nr:hypothetical protein Tdes44962_MAKER05562 [Teratosphaeria destructans]